MQNRYFSPDHDDSMGAMDLFDLGLENVAYVKSITDGGDTVWAIFQSDGTQIGAAPTRDLAFAAIVQHEMAPVSVH